MGALEERVRVAQFRYDIDVHGGAVGDITLIGALPIDAIVVGGMIDVQTAGASGGDATVALKFETDEDVLTATAGAVANLTEGAIIDIVPDHTAANAIRIVDADRMTMTIGTAALTAGKLDIHVEYLMPVS